MRRAPGDPPQELQRDCVLIDKSPKSVRKGKSAIDLLVGTLGLLAQSDFGPLNAAVLVDIRPWLGMHATHAFCSRGKPITHIPKKA